MKKILLSFFIISISFFAKAQKGQGFLSNSIRINPGRSFHGTGDLRGIMFFAEYGHYLKKHFEITGSFTTTIHSGAFESYYTNQFGTYDNSFRYTTAGFQAAGKFAYVPLHLNQHEFKISTGGLIRFQSSSSPDILGWNSGQSSGFPEPFYTIRNEEKQNIITLGYLAELNYIFSFTNNLQLGANIGFQNDTNSDVITYYGLTLGKRFGSCRKRE